MDLDALLENIYMALSMKPGIPKDLKEMWKEMSRDESKHLKYWHYLQEREYNLKVLQLEDKKRAKNIMKKLIAEAGKTLKKVKNNDYTPLEMLEFTMNMEYSALISPMQRIMNTHDIIFDKTVFNPKTMYEDHLDRFTDIGLKKFKNDRMKYVLLNSIKLLLNEKRKLVTASVRDPLTGLKNRRYFFQNAAFLLEVARRDKKPVAVLLCDIDKFKEINDRYGHPSGDKVLVQVSNLFQKEIRASDIVARYGGDEFIFMLFNQDAERAGEFIARLKGGLEKLTVNIAPEVTITPDISIGYAIDYSGKSKRNLGGLIKEADKKMYEQKNYSGGPLNL
ncbi:MAG: GGDEF domain-containing protein [Elusimicrobia bacterium]|nr:GGDEF domain-containing protein [Elusimicrobiota bacterium]